MSSNRPLQYDSLKVVLQFIEANFRYKLSIRIPSIRAAEKAAPMRLDKIAFDILGTRVNDTTYRLGIVFEYPDVHEISKNHQRFNERGGYHSDFTEHGFETHLIKHVVTPGDVEISSSRTQQIPWGEGEVFDRDQLFLERHIEVYERALLMRIERGDDGTINDESMYVGISGLLGNEQLDPVERTNIETQMLEGIVLFSAEKLRAWIKDFREGLVPYYCRRDNTPLPYTHKIQLAVESPRGKQIYRHSYNLKLQEAMKKLNTALFGGRNCIHVVKSLHLMYPTMVIRLPECFRIEIRELRSRGVVSRTYESLKAIVEESSYPLEVLTMESELIQTDNYNHQVIKKAKKLVIELERDQNGVVLPVLRNLENPNAHLRCMYRMFPMEDQVALIQHWIDTEKDHMSFLSYEVEGMTRIENFQQLIVSQLMGSRSGDNLFTIPTTTNGRNIEVKCILLEVPDEQRNEPTWRVEIRVVDGPE